MNVASAPLPVPASTNGTEGRARCGIVLDLSDGKPLGLLLPTGSVAQLLRNVRATLVPNTPPWLCGLLNRHGNLVPLFDLPHYFGLAARARCAHAVVVGDGDAAFALPVAVEPRVLPPDMAHDDVRDAPHGLDGFIGATYRHDGQHWYDFRFDLWLVRLAAGTAPAPLIPSSSLEKPA